MSTEFLPAQDPSFSAVVLPARCLPPELNNGDRMTREEFHRLYEQTPEDFKAELVGGIVFVASPVKRTHGKSHILLGALLAAYEAQTPGVDCGDNTTVILSDDAEPQPDLFMRVLPECGGRSKTVNDYLEGAPEFVIEVAVTSRSIDLHAKKDDYSRHGVLEYLVVCAREKQFHWFDLTASQQLQPDAEGVYRIRTFPGLWINGPALLTHDYSTLMKTLETGLTSLEHADFVQRLAQQRHAATD
jgi:Uma2 family endonuclease